MALVAWETAAVVESVWATVVAVMAVMAGVAAVYEAASVVVRAAFPPPQALRVAAAARTAGAAERVGVMVAAEAVVEVVRVSAGAGVRVTVAPK